MVVKISSVFSMLFFICFFNYLGYSQFYYERYDSVKVIQNGYQLQFPWAGGLHNPQLSEIDLNGDGIQDLFVNERWGNFVDYGNKILTFINKGIIDSVSYVYAPEYEKIFPYLKNWALLRDFNCDGKVDIFASVPSGIAIYENNYDSNNGLSFSLYSNMLYYKNSSNYNVNVYVSSVDIPAIDDIDGDGDIDILTFDILGGYIDYFQNQTMETYAHCDSLNYKNVTSCWGFFYETFNCGSYYLGDTCYNYMADDSKYYKDQAHSGSTILSWDMDGDSDKDLLLGDISCFSLSYAQNGGSATTAYITQTDSTLSACDIPVDIDNFPAAFSIDANNDGKKDLIAAPNVTNGGISLDNCWYYKNVGTGSTTTLEYQTSQFLQNDMIDAGQNNYPVFVDYNVDGFLDLVMGNYAYYSNGQYISSLTLYQNTGTNTNPQFDLLTRDWLNSSSLGLKSLAPTFGDLDNDGDLDMILGEEEGNIHLFTNSAGAGNIMSLSLTTAYYQSIDVDKASMPQLVDVNRDNLLDLIIGKKTGYINYYKNTGTPTSAIFTLQTDSFGKVDVQIPGWYTGYSTPFLTEIDSTHEYYLYVGSENGKVYLYNNIDNNLTGEFTLIDSIVQHNTVGSRSAPTLADIDNNGNLEMAVGNFRGGLSLFKQSDSLVGIMENNKTKTNLTFSVYPNPANNLISIQSNNTKSAPFTVCIYNSVGQIVNEYSCKDTDTPLQIDISNLRQGIYYLEITSKESHCNNRFVVQR